VAEASTSRITHRQFRHRRTSGLPRDFDLGWIRSSSLLFSSMPFSPSWLPVLPRAVVIPGMGSARFLGDREGSERIAMLRLEYPRCMNSNGSAAGARADKRSVHIQNGLQYFKVFSWVATPEATTICAERRRERGIRLLGVLHNDLAPAPCV